MDFFSAFGGGSSSVAKTPVSTAIDQATNDMLMGPDWAKNMEIVDLVNSRTTGV